MSEGPKYPLFPPKLYPCTYVVSEGHRESRASSQKVCGKKTHNRFYCPPHHSAVSQGSDPYGAGITGRPEIRIQRRGFIKAGS